LGGDNILEATKSLSDLLGTTELYGKTFLDIGCGSGLFSLAACSLGAKVHSFDSDPLCIKCTRKLKAKHLPHGNWVIERGSILNKKFLKSLGQFDIVYSWGVLHHTGDMWQALENTISLGDKLVIAVYNDWNTAFWYRIKKLYCSGWKFFICGVFIPYYFFKNCLKVILKKDIKRNRGMSVYYDWLDWLGGYPYQTAKVEEIFDFFSDKGFELRKIKTVKKIGSNQFVFERSN